MTFRAFEAAFADYAVIPIVEMEKAFPGFDRNALTRWQRKGYLEKIRQGFYRLTTHPVTGDADRFLVANRIYHPSYVSLQSAMRWYDFIPEGVFTTTSVSTWKTAFFDTPVGAFQYRTLKKGLFFGYRLQGHKGQHFKIAEPEKALLDYLYLHPHLGHADDFHELRLNAFEIKEKTDWGKMKQYLSLFKSNALSDRLETLEKYLLSHDVHL